MGLLNKIYNLVWHGDCDDPECISLDLTEYKDKIDFVFQVSDINSGWMHWSSATDNLNLGDFNELICGIPYVIKLKSTDKINPDEELEIPNLAVGTFAKTDEDATPKRITENCVPVIECSFFVDNIRPDRFDLTINLYSLDPAGTNKFIRGVEIIFNHNLVLNTEKILAITFDEKYVSAIGKEDTEKSDLYKELSERTTSMMSYGRNKNRFNKFGFADLREFGKGISFEEEYETSFKFRIPYETANDGEIEVVSANIFDTTIERNTYDYILCTPAVADPTPTPTPTRTPTPTYTPKEKLWIGFTGEGYYSPFYEVDTIDTKDVTIPFDNLEGYNKFRENFNLNEVKEGDVFQEENYISEILSPFANDPSVVYGVTISQLNGAIIKKNTAGNLEVTVNVPMGYSRFVISDSDYDTDLWNWANGKKADRARVSNIQGIMITMSENRPGEKLNSQQRASSFNSSLLSLKCNDEWNYELQQPTLFANLRIDAFDSQRGNFLAKYGHWGPNHGYLAPGKPWAGANMVYTAPQPTSLMNDASGENRIGIKEFYFIRGTDESQKIDFSQGNPRGSAC